MSNMPPAGAVAAIHRYPVKSMMGESLNATEIGSAGVLHDRSLALFDTMTGKVVSAKNPGKWPTLFNFRAALAESVTLDHGMPTVRITLPDGRLLMADDPVAMKLLSDMVGREVKLLHTSPPGATLEEYWPNMEELPNRDVVTNEAMPAGTFFDCATLHLLTTATLDALRALHPAGRFEPRRFRPNFIVGTAPGTAGFAENEWIGKTLSIGPEVKLHVSGPCPRCVMTTLAQDDLPADPLILKTAAKHNKAHVGVYATVEQGGIVRRGDAVVVH